MLSIDEIKKLLIEQSADNAAASYDAVLTDLQDTYQKYSEMENKQSELQSSIDSLTLKVNELAKTNLDLIDRIKYADDTNQGSDPASDDSVDYDIDIKDLFD